ncbi:hypothetical protein LZZ85_21115 [Terrimonas sp. NA20]|uniref:Uncharacterized protein n=1 Tax=Terrimonas ginsenosidimutans TaxID=2908004 RepID=A0ABS9KWZ4_9BACT|nr:hypothetical protein [Terrimonas ginsenosidimutans]MCG2616813.1 hypothetical protein [Terrimonas ginsenosidimutans]
MAAITTVKRQLYNQLKGQRGVIGAGIKGTGSSEYIVIFVQNLTARLLAKIPGEFKGIKVKTERIKMPSP